jgi:hypothetical protein
MKIPERLYLVRPKTLYKWLLDQIEQSKIGAREQV